MDFLKALKQDMAVERALLLEYEKSMLLLEEGRLNCKTIRGNPEYYEVKNEEAKHIHPRNWDKIVTLRTKGFLKKSIKILKKNLKWQEKLLEAYRRYNLEDVESLLSNAYDERRLTQWMNRYYRRNPYHLEHKKYKTSFGLLVRSKSEVMIAELLHAAGIPFHYDEEVFLIDADGQEHVFYVDFVIMTPSGKLLYWEHMGLFDQEKYRKQSFKKMKAFFDNGIILSENLIITMDSEKYGLSIPTIERVIREQILPHFEEVSLKSVSYERKKYT